MGNISSLARYQGCIIGGAVGDALGWPVEFHSLEEIHKEYGPSGIVDLVPAEGGVGAVTDDTQMTLFTAEGLLDGLKIGDGVVDFVATLHAAYLRWLRTQDEAGPLPADTGLVAIPGLHARRAPGLTCLSALESGRIGTPSQPINDSKGCGGVMRVAPVGLFCAALHADAEPAVVARKAFVLGGSAAAITHGHPSGYLSAGAFAALIALLSCGMPLEAAVQESAALLEYDLKGAECLGALRGALSLWQKGKGTASPETVETLGQGWTGEEALAISVFCALAAKGDFASGVRLAVNHSGDSDSTGAITGNILGALLGESAIPKGWSKTVELRHTLASTGQSLLTQSTSMRTRHPEVP